MQEIWKDISGYEGIYQVSNLGNIRSCERKVYFKKGNPLTSYMTVPEKIISKHISNTGYYRVGLRKDGKRKFLSVHRIVTSAFIDNPENKPHVNHIDGNRLNNHSDNLEWVTCQENIIHARDTGLSHGLKGI